MKKIHLHTRSPFGVPLLFLLFLLCFRQANAQLTVNAGNDTTICYNSYSYLNGTAAGGTPPYSFHWSPASGVSNPNISNPYVITAASETLILTVTDSLLNTGTDTINVTIDHVTIGQAFFDKCQSGCITLQDTASGGTEPYTYQWGWVGMLSCNSCANPVCCYSIPGGYVDGVSVTDAWGCSANSSTGSISVHPDPVVSLGADVSVCSGTCTTITGSVTNGTPPLTYNWIPSNNLSCFNCLPATACPVSSQTYTLLVTDIYGCLGEDSIHITVNPLPAVNLTPVSDFICLGDTATINFNGAVTYSIFPPALSATANSFLVNPPANTLFTVTGTDLNGCSDTTQAQVYIDSFCVWPGDANYDGSVDNTDLLPIGLAYGNAGPVRASATIGWYHQPATDWSLSNTVNDKHIDTNGDGIIDQDDTLAITQNFGLIHPRLEAESFSRNSPPLQLIILEDTVGNLDTIHALIALGDTMNVAGNIYGLAFTLGYNNQIVDTNTAHISFANSSFAPSGNRVSLEKDFWANGELKAGVSRIDHTNFSGTGIVGLATIDITTDNIDGKMEAVGDTVLKLNLNTISAVDASGNPVALQPIGDSVVVQFVPNGYQHVNAKNFNMLLYPNPATDELVIAFGGTVPDELVIMNLFGQKEFDISNPAAANHFDVKNLPAGIYTVEAISKNKKTVKKLIVTR